LKCAVAVCALTVEPTASSKVAAKSLLRLQGKVRVVPEAKREAMGGPPFEKWSVVD
jgi:hypothetical protein